MYLFQSVLASHDHRVSVCVVCQTQINHTRLMRDCSFNQMSRRKICYRIQSNRKYLSLPFWQICKNRNETTTTDRQPKRREEWKKKNSKPSHLICRATKLQLKNFLRVSTRKSYIVHWYTHTHEKLSAIEFSMLEKRKNSNEIFAKTVSRWLVQCYLPPMRNDDSVDIRSLQELKNNVNFMRNRDKSAAHTFVRRMYRV